MVKHDVTEAPGSSDAFQASLEEQLAELRGVVAEQQQAISALERRLTSDPAQSDQAKDAAGADQAMAARSRRTSRRGLLRGAAAGAAVAAVATVAVSAAQPAHAAPQNDGGAFTLGQVNTADVSTSLYPVTGTTPSRLLLVDNVLGGGDAISGFGPSGSSGVSGYMGNSAGNGVYGQALGASGYAVRGDAMANGVGVFGNSTGYVGVQGTGIGATGVGGFFQGGRAALALGLGGDYGPPLSGAHYAGDIFLDVAAVVWVCVADGTPGTWVRLTSVGYGAPGGCSTFLSAPLRLLDTRPGNLAYYNPGVKLTPGDNYFQVNYVMFNGVTVPHNISGVIGNVTTINAVGPGFLSISSAAVGFSGTSNLVFEPGQIIANAFSSAVGLNFSAFALGEAGIDVFINANPVDVIVDLFAVII